MAIRLRRLSSEQLVATGVLVAVTAFVLWQFHPEFLIRDTTPAFYDLGDHLTTPAHLRDTLLPSGRLTGWSQAWFTGFPSLTFYFPVPPLLAVVLDLVLPYNVAFKLTAAMGPLTLPAAAYAFGRLNQRSPLTSACFGASALVVLLQPLLWRLGGSVSSAALGEYSYGISFSCSLLAFGLASAGLRTGRYRAITSVVLAAGLLSHVVPMVTTLIGLVVLVALRPAWASVRWTLSVMLTALALSAVWLLPLLSRLGFTAGPSGEKTERIWSGLWPSEMAPVAILALAGLGMAVLRFVVDPTSRRPDLEIFMVTMAIISAVLIVVFPRLPVEDTRFLPSWYLWLSLSAASAVAQSAEFFDRQRAHSARGQKLQRPNLVQLSMPVVLLIALLPLWDSRFVDGLLTRKKSMGKPIDTNLIMGGYEQSAMGPEFAELIHTLRRLGRDHGCGRAEFEYNNDTWDDFRLSLTDLASYWTKGCITATTGILYQSSATGDYLIEANERLSFDSAIIGRRQKVDFDLARGVADLRVLGVRYFGASDYRTQQAADASSGLRVIAETRPYENRRWKLYEVLDVEVVEPLAYEPVVVGSLAGSRRSWVRPAHQWFDSHENRDVVIVSDGPSSWHHSDRIPTSPPRRPVSQASVRRVRIDDHKISFDVSETGTPVLVKVSYFPNWRAKGADGPWRATPNHMVVVPRSSTVTLKYERSAPEIAGSLLTVGGVAATTLLARRPPLSMPVPLVPEPVSTPSRKTVPGKRKKRRK